MALLTFITRKRISEQKLATAFVNSLVESVERSFPEVAQLINNDPDFVIRPDISENDYEHFLMLVLAGNIKMIGESFEPELEKPLTEDIFDKCAQIFNTDKHQFIKTYKEYCEFMNRVNHPSKNVLYSMSKAVFYKYDLNKYQVDYFRNLNTPNPIFLKRMNDIMSNFIWSWESFFEKYKVVL